MCFFKKKKAEKNESVNSSVSSRPSESSKMVSIVLQRVDGDKVKIIKIVQRITKESLPRAKHLVEYTPAVIASNIPFMEAQSIKLELERAGATVGLTENL